MIGTPVNRSELIRKIATKYNINPKMAESVVKAIVDAMALSLQEGERIEIRGFGSFIVKDRPAREGRNPRTGAVVAVAAKKVPLFKVGKELRLRVDGQPATKASNEDPNETSTGK